MKHRSMEMKDGGIEYAQSYGAGSAGNAMSERNALGFRHTNGANAACHVYAVYPRNECGPRVNRQGQQRQ
jgi:hypothetical protein